MLYLARHKVLIFSIDILQFFIIISKQNKDYWLGISTKLSEKEIRTQKQVQQRVDLGVNYL